MYSITIICAAWQLEYETCKVRVYQIVRLRSRRCVLITASNTNRRASQGCSSWTSR